MIRTPWRRREEPLDHAELARLLPAPGDPELSSDRLSGLEEHLMTEIRNRTPDPAPDPAPAPVPGTAPDTSTGAPPAGLHEGAHASRPVRRPGRRPVLVGVAAALALAAAGVAGLAGSPGGSSGSESPGRAVAPPAGAVPAPVVQVVRGSTAGLAGAVADISGAAARAELPEPGPGQFLYVRSEVSWLVSWEGADGKNKSYVDKIHPREVWMSPDGRKGWLIEPYKEAVDRGGITLDDPEGGERTLNSPSYDYLRTLPTDPEILLKKIYDETRGMGNGPDQQAFSTIGDLLREQVAPPKLAAGLYRAAARIPGVVLVDDSVDAAGRHGIAIARTDEGDGSRTEWIFDRETYTYLGERTVQTRDAEGIKAGTVKGHTAVTDRAVVDAVKQRPAGSAPGERAPAPATPSAGT
ncbi:CU044_5270 family protein [Streptomyces sp. CA-278952]|uniref:CU044_5270 family protein n=1 Tax=Streptomyces sp. CA-278952 TaxID=2980556 RepID=UPI002367541B|nr:CU044_5270 family protein [Streptomyces sp. CA-278952]WDG30657.1 CU044_5270 family protein [Streptomyces sp. CA-278952]